jgi:putative transposase
VKAAEELAAHVGVKPACVALSVARATYYRRLRPSTGHQRSRPTPARALSEKEQDEVFDTLCSPRFVDRSPGEVTATLLDEGLCLCSERTMYRVLASRAAVQERRPQRIHPEYTKPELMATAPNQVWSWDITRLLGPQKWSYFYLYVILYVILDIFSRYVVGWMVANRENSAMAGRLIQQSCLKFGVQPQILTLHSDRGAPMTSQCTAQLLADLGVTRSLSRPQVSDDNPFSEAHFKTLKYHPSFPGRFEDQDRAKTFCRSFFPWYNTEHRHGGISMLTPEQVHFGQADRIIARRETVLREAWAAHLERFVSGEPKPKPLPQAVWINPPSLSLSTLEIAL